MINFKKIIPFSFSIFYFMLTASLLLLSTFSYADKTKFSGVDFSGIYHCTGTDDHEGPYKGTVTLQLIPNQSVNEYGAYSFKLDAEGYGIYLGEAAAQNFTMAMHFALTDPKPKDFGTGIAQFSKNSAGKWTFKKYYYEPEFKGGNFGIENCVMQ